jgi:hypothetical protein
MIYAAAKLQAYQNSAMRFVLKASLNIASCGESTHRE